MVKINKHIVMGYIALLEDQNRNAYMNETPLTYRMKHESITVIVQDGYPHKTLGEVAREIFKEVCPSPWYPFNLEALKRHKQEWS